MEKLPKKVGKIDLSRNGYPSHFIRKNINSLSNNSQAITQNSDNKYISVPYIKGTSERVGKILKNYNIVLSNKASNTLHNKLSNSKEKQAFTDKTDVVYKIDCLDCDGVYIGETKKQAKERIREHELAVVNRSSTSLVFKHCENENHTMNFDNYSILSQNSYAKPRKILESFYTYSNTNAFNRSTNFSEIYKPSVNKLINID